MDLLSILKKATLNSMPYRFYMPTKKVRGIVLHLHGSGGRGDDNIGQLNYMDTPAFHAILKRDDLLLLAPQIPIERRFVNVEWKQVLYDLDAITESEDMKTVHALVMEWKQKTQCDTLLVTGYSMGGFATFDYACRHSDQVSIAVPICGGVSVHHLSKARHIEFCIVHGALDPVVPCTGSAQAYQTLRTLQAKTDYREYADQKHDVWHVCYQDSTFFTRYFEERLQKK